MIKPRNTAEKLLKKYIESIVVNKSSIGKESIMWMIGTLEFTVRVLQRELESR